MLYIIKTDEYYIEEILLEGPDDFDFKANISGIKQYIDCAQYAQILIKHYGFKIVSFNTFILH